MKTIKQTMKTVLITGANVGLGKECARQLAVATEEGSSSIEKIYLACRSEEKAKAAKADLETSTGKNVFDIIIMDTSSKESVKKAVSEIDGVIDGIVMNAGGPLAIDTKTSDGVTMSFAANLLGHVVLTETLLETNKLTTGSSVVYVSSEVFRGVPEMGMAKLLLTNNSIEDFKGVADGTYMENLKPKPKDPTMDSYGYIKYMGTLWMSALSRKYPDIRFVSVSPGASTGTNAVANMDSAIMRIVYGLLMKVMTWIGKAHGVEDGAKRYVDVLLDDGDTYKSGKFYASIKGVAGPIGDQAELHYPNLNDTKIQDNANEAIHSFM